jgi:hypothetical protein
MHCCRDQLLHRLLIGNIAPLRNGDASGINDRPSRPFCRFFVNVSGYYSRATKPTAS